MATPEAFLLLAISNASITSPTGTQTGLLGLECVTVGQDVYLVLQMGTTEIPLDPYRVINFTLSDSGDRIYKLPPTETDPSEIQITISPPKGTPDPIFLEDLETFESLLAQYGELKGVPEIMGAAVPATVEGPGVAEALASVPEVNIGGGGSDLRGHLVLVNQDNGEVVGEFDQKIKVAEDPILSEPGHEHDPVVIEIPVDAEFTGTAREVFARSVPPDQRGLIGNSANFVSHAISTTTNLLLTVVSSASSYYISHSKSAPPRTPDGPPPPPPPRALVFLTSERTRKGLSNVHALTGQAVKVSGKTIDTIDKMIGRYIGGKKNKAPPSPIRSPVPLPAQVAGPSIPGGFPNPPPYAATLTPDGKPALPPRRSPSPNPSPVSPPSPNPALAPPLPPRKVGTKAKIVLSIDLILTTLEESAKQFLDVSTEKLAEAVEHKYGPEAAQSSRYMTGSVKNVVLVYIDMRGIGRKALIKKVGKEFVKGQFRKKDKA